jgi:hypothetical protein
LFDTDTGVNREPVTGIDVNFLDDQGNHLASDKTKNAPAEVALCYSDDDGDGIVDGTNIPEITLLMFWDSDDDGDLDLQISTPSDVDTDENCVTGTVPGFSGGGIVGSPSAPSAPSVSAGGGGSSCFIATAAYGTPFAYDIDILRAFRDRFLVDNAVGRAFVETYYKLSPGPAEYISRHDGLRAATRMVLKPVVFGAWMFMEKDRAAWTSLFLISGLAGMIITIGIRRRNGKSARRR